MNKISIVKFCNTNWRALTGWKNCPRLLKLCQSDKILPNLVTLLFRQSNVTCTIFIHQILGQNCGCALPHLLLFGRSRLLGLQGNYINLLNDNFEETSCQTRGRRHSSVDTSSPTILRYRVRIYLVNIVLYLSFIWETDENKQKEARFGPYFQLQRLLSLCSVLAFIDSPLMDH